MMISSHTVIDTITLQIDCNNNQLQRDTVFMLIEYLQVHYSAYFDPVEYIAGFDRRIEHKLYYCGNGIKRTLLSIKTGYSNGLFYIKICFAGLASGTPMIDSYSIKYLWAVVAYLNTNAIAFCIAELDIAIDIPNIYQEQLLAFCSSRTSGTQYNDLQEIQRYEGETYYIEKFQDKATANRAVKRAYLYDKREKEFKKHNLDIGYELQRFEMKLQPKYFHRYRLDINTIEHTLNKYYLLYFENPTDRQYIIDRYNGYSKVTSRELERMDLEPFRLYVDMGYIVFMLYHIQTITMDHLYCPYGA